MNSTSNANSQCLMDTQDSSAAYHPSMYITFYYNQQIDASFVLRFLDKRSKVSVHNWHTPAVLLVRSENYYFVLVLAWRVIAAVTYWVDQKSAVKRAQRWKRLKRHQPEKWKIVRKKDSPFPVWKIVGKEVLGECIGLQEEEKTTKAESRTRIVHKRSRHTIIGVRALFSLIARTARR